MVNSASLNLGGNSTPEPCEQILSQPQIMFQLVDSSDFIMLMWSDRVASQHRRRWRAKMVRKDTDIETKPFENSINQNFL